MDFLTILEWVSFGMGAGTVFCYGHSKKQGGVMGVTTAILFMLWGVLGGFWGAFTINIGFLILHARNLSIAIKSEVNHD